MKLDELAQKLKTLDEAKFRAAHPHPALVFGAGPAPSADAINVDTPSKGTKLSPTENLGRTQTLKKQKYLDDVSLLGETSDGEGDKRSTDQALGLSTVVFLVKTPKNPFAGMITVGRAVNNDICLPLTTVSKVHAYFTKGPREGWKVTDQRATNGTFVDGKRILSGSTTELVDGTRIGFGPETTARFFSPEGLYGFLALYRSGVKL